LAETLSGTATATGAAHPSLPRGTALDRYVILDRCASPAQRICLVIDGAAQL
jgi:hypothetical protein